MEKVRAGEAVAIRASTWNAFVDAANYVREARQNSLGRIIGLGCTSATSICSTSSTAKPSISRTNAKNSQPKVT